MRVFLIAGEASGDALGGALMAGLRELQPDAVFDGIGGAAMQAEGLQSRFEMSELSVMGLAEVLPKYRHLKRRIAETAEAVLAERPDVLITVDSPDFCLRVARKVKAASDIRVVHYVSPTVWAWRPGRAKKMVGVVDQVLALFPFEPPYLEAVGIRCDFVGHPVVAEPVADAAAVARLREERSLTGPTLAVLPGSRRSEVRRLAPVFEQAVARFAQDVPDLQVILPVAPGLGALVAEETGHWPVRPILLPPGTDKSAAFQAADLALAASGTVSLELAAAGTPMVIAYDMAWISRQIISRMLTVDTVTLVNLVSETRAVPEFIGANCRPEPIAEGLRRVFREPEAQRAAMAATMARLGKGTEAPGLRAARAVLSAL